MSETSQSDHVSYPVVGRCNDMHDDYQGSLLRGIIFMRNGDFCAGVEELGGPDSLTASDITFPEGPHFKTYDEAVQAADNLAHDASQANKLRYESDSDQSNDPEISTVKQTSWVSVDELDEIRSHVGRITTEEDGEQYYAGIERSHRGGDSEIGWYGPYPSAYEAEVARGELTEEELMPPEPEPVLSAPGMR